MEAKQVNDEQPRCEICGKPATCFTRDVYRREVDGGRLEYTPAEIVYARCYKHKRESETIDISSLYDFGKQGETNG